MAAAQAQASDIVWQAEESANNACGRSSEAAHAEAQAIIDQARQHAAGAASRTQPPISAEAVATLSAAIEDFANTNRVLVAELSQLRQSLAASTTASLDFQHAPPAALPGPGTDQTSWYPAPQAQQYAQQSHAAPVQQYQVAPAQEYAQQSYAAPVQQYQVAPAQEYAQQSYAAPAQQYQVAPAQEYAQQSYAAPAQPPLHTFPVAATQVPAHQDYPATYAAENMAPFTGPPTQEYVNGSLHPTVTNQY